MSDPETKSVAVIGGGTMGLGIAQLSLLSGARTFLVEPDEGTRNTAKGRLAESLSRGVQKGVYESDADGLEEALEVLGSPEELTDARVVIEAVPESLEAKHAVFGTCAEKLGPDALLLTNTSSIPVSAIAAGVPNPERVAGMHFFNPPTRMKLVEVIGSEFTDPRHLDEVSDLARSFGRTPVRAADVIGFVANRCARPFTLEALRLLGERRWSAQEIDLVVRSGLGFRMGSFELLDLIGIDTNFAIAQSFYDQSFGEIRWRPSPIQRSLVDSGRLGRKSGQGFYSYESDPYRAEDPIVESAPSLDGEALTVTGVDRAEEIASRMAFQIVNEAYFALGEQVASPADIDTAMTLGFNWPKGPVSLGKEIGLKKVLEGLEALRETLGEAYRPAPALRQSV